DQLGDGGLGEPGALGQARARDGGGRGGGRGQRGEDGGEVVLTQMCGLHLCPLRDGSGRDGIGAAPRRLWSTAWHVDVSYGNLLTAAYGGVPPRIDEGAISMTAPTPTRDDKFSFGLWTTGWQAQDQFGAATRPALDMTAHIRRLAELGAWGFTFHDNDIVPFDATPQERQQIIDQLKKVTAETGLVIEMVTTDTFAHPVFKDGAFTSNDRSVRRFGLRKVLANVDL